MPIATGCRSLRSACQTSEPRGRRARTSRSTINSHRADLRDALVRQDLRKIELWTARHGVALADWPAEPVDPFFNVNTPEDAAAAERLAVQYPGA